MSLNTKAGAGRQSKLQKPRAQGHGGLSVARLVSCCLATLACASAHGQQAAAQQAAAQPAPALQPTASQDTAQPKDRPALETVTVEAERAKLQNQIRAFVGAIAVAPFDDSIKRWRAPICPLVAGLTRDHGEFILGSVSRIARAAGAPLAPEKCRGNLYVIVTAAPEDLLKAWGDRDVDLFGDAGMHQIRKFISTAGAVRVWYNARLEAADGSPLGEFGGVSGGIPENTHARGFRLAFDDVRDLTSVMVIVDSRRARGVNFNQLAGYVAMVGLAQIRPDADVGATPTILKLFTAVANAPADGLSTWDEAYLKALYHTDQADKMQLAEIRTSMLRDITH
ncbi:MAG TPA: hypothetical protein VLX90_16530 [Steroidobacteraceae bacterium]|nr:hypothetical protein [Steroidobacteraceae bacterium]